MATVRFEKVVSSLPDPLEANTIYLVRVGAGFDQYVSDSTGTVAHKLNSGNSNADEAALFAIMMG